jgi:hypothetical protein
MGKKKKSVPIDPGFNSPLMQVGPDGKDYATGLTVADLYGDDISSYSEATGSSSKPSDRKKKAMGGLIKGKPRLAKKGWR